MLLTDIGNLCTQFQVKCVNHRENQIVRIQLNHESSHSHTGYSAGWGCFFCIFNGPLLLPRYVLEAKTLAIKHGLSQMTPGLPGTIVEAIKSLFSKTLDSKDVLLAAVTLPKFRRSRVREEIGKQPNELLLTTEYHSLTEEPPAQMHDAQPAAAIFTVDAPPHPPLIRTS